MKFSKTVFLIKKKNSRNLEWFNSIVYALRQNYQVNHDLQHEKNTMSQDFEQAQNFLNVVIRSPPTSLKWTGSATVGDFAQMETYLFHNLKLITN